jgi:ribosomal protein S19
MITFAFLEETVTTGVAFQKPKLHTPLPPLYKYIFSTFIYKMPRAAWKGPFFVAFPGLKQAVQAGTPIATQGNITRYFF